MVKIHNITIICIFTVLSMRVYASQIVYQPINPNFGGNPLNSSLLLQQASINNHFLTNPSASNPLTSNTSANFSKQVRESLLSALESQAAQIAVNSILGTNGQSQNQGTVNIAGTVIQFQRSNGQININITDGTNGGTTQISVPVPQF